MCPDERKNPTPSQIKWIKILCSLTSFNIVIDLDIFFVLHFLPFRFLGQEPGYIQSRFHRAHQDLQDTILEDAVREGHHRCQGHQEETPDPGEAV